MKFFQPSVRLTNQKPRAFVSVRQTNQITLFPFVCSFVLLLLFFSVLFASFHFRVTRKLFIRLCRFFFILLRSSFFISVSGTLKKKKDMKIYVESFR